MIRVLKWAGLIIGGLVGIVIIAVLVLYFLGGSRVGKTYEIQVADVAVPSGPEAVERGRHYVEAIGLCGGCHGDFNGKSCWSSNGVSTSSIPD